MRTVLCSDLAIFLFDLRTFWTVKRSKHLRYLHRWDRTDYRMICCSIRGWTRQSRLLGCPRRSDCGPGSFEDIFAFDIEKLQRLRLTGWISCLDRRRQVWDFVAKPSVRSHCSEAGHSACPSIRTPLNPNLLITRFAVTENQRCFLSFSKRDR